MKTVNGCTGVAELDVIFQPAIEPGHLPPFGVEARVAERTVADRLVRASSVEPAMPAVGDDDGLLTGGILRSSLVEEGHRGTRRDVIEGLGPQARHANAVGVRHAIGRPCRTGRRTARQILLEVGPRRACGSRHLHHRQVQAHLVVDVVRRRHIAVVGDGESGCGALAFLIGQAGW